MARVSSDEVCRPLRGLALVAAAGWTAAAILIGYMVTISWPDHLFRTDFVSFWTAASMVRDGAGPALFDMEAQRAFQAELRLDLASSEEVRLGKEYNPFPNLPPLALPYLPLTSLPAPLAYLAWWVISLVAFLVAVSVLLRGQPWARSWAVVMLSFGAVTSTLYEGQAYGIFLLALALGLVALRSGRPFLGGPLLGMLWMKPQYAVLFPVVLLVKGRWRELAGMGVAGLALGAVSLLLVGVGGMVDYSAFLREIGSFEYPSVGPGAMVNWRSLLMHLWPGVPASVGGNLVLALGGATALASLLAWRGPWAPSSNLFPCQLMTTILASMIASPHSHFHGMAMLIAPLALMLPGSGAGLPVGGALRWVLLLTYLLAGVAWLFIGLRWLMAPLLLLAMVVSIVQIRRTANLRVLHTGVSR